MNALSLDELTDALVAASPVLDARGRLLARAVYSGLAHGRPVSDTNLAVETQLPLDDVRSTLASWPALFRDNDDHVVGFGGLALSKMPHALDVNGIHLYAWCAFDTLFLPGVLRADAFVQSKDPHRGEPVTLTVTPNKVSERSHDQMVVSFLTPSQRFDSTIITSFCHYVHFFTDPTSAAHWLAGHDGTFLLELDDAFELATRWNTARGL